MNIPNDDEVPRVETTGFGDVKLEPSERLDRWRRFGYRILLLGMTPEQFMDKSSIKSTLLYLMLFLFHTVFAVYEAIVALFLSRSLLEQVTHAYITTYIVSFNSQWYFMLLNVRKFHENEIHIENFESTRAHLDFAKRAFDKNIDTFLKCVAMSSAWWSTNSMSYIIGPGVEELLSFIRNGEFKQVFVVPQVFSMPWWAQIIVYFYNAISTFIILLYVISSFIIMGLRVLKIKTQCDILNEALRRDVGEQSNIKAYIKDHIEIIRAAKELNGQLATLSALVFTACYLQFAMQMFALTLFEPSGAYFFTLAFDLFSIFLILAIQCWMASIITHSLFSVSTAVYETQWYRRDKDNALNVLIMSQMAQRTYIQTIWFGSMTVDRAAILSLVRSSYSMYTILMIFQNK